MRLPVITRNLGDQADLSVAETGELLAVADHIIAVFVVPAVADEKANVMEQPAHLEEFSIGRPETVDRLRTVEELKSQSRAVFGVVNIGVELLGQSLHVGAPQIMEVVGGSAG